MNDRETSFLTKVYNGLIQIWPQISDETVPGQNDFSYCRLNGQGATSLYYKLTVKSSTGSDKCFFIKKYGGMNTDEGLFWEPQVKKDYELSNYLNKYLKNFENFIVDKPYLLLHDENIIVSPYIEGINLHNYFVKSLRFGVIPEKAFSEIEDLIYLIGKGLVELQGIPIEYFGKVINPLSPEKACSNYLKNFDKYADSIEKEIGSSDLIESARNQLDNQLERHLRNFRDHCFQHTDYILQNFILDYKGCLHLIDFPNADIGYPYPDIAHFINSLEDLTYLKIVSQRRISRLISTFYNCFAVPNDFSRQTFLLFKLYFQFYSTAIILSGEKSRQTLKQIFCLKNPRTYFLEKVKSILEKLD